MSREHRRHVRHTVEVAAEVDVGSEIVTASTQNLSAGGAALVADRALPEGKPLRVTLFLTQDGIEDPDEEPFECRAIVMWLAENDDGARVAGVRFEGVPPAQLARLDRFLAHVDDGARR